MIENARFLALVIAPGLAFVTLEMTATFVLARRVNNFGIVDIVWSVGFTPLALLYFTWSARNLYFFGGSQYPLLSGGRTLFEAWPRSAVFTAMVAIWSMRLGIHLFVRVKSHHPTEDVRYARLRHEWGQRVGTKMFGFFLLQGVLQVVLSIPVVLVNLNLQRSYCPLALGWPETFGILLWFTGLIGESLADRQLAAFRADPANRGKVCQAGLWNHSRHPNYFFEWMIWVGYAVFALGSPLGWLGLIAPALMFHFLHNVTGIPMTEALSVRSKGDAYREYQRTTSAFVPWMKKKSGSNR